MRRYMPLARHVAARYRGGSEPMEDLQQVAALGLLKAIDRFDPARGTSFSTYAVPTISGEVRRHFRDHTWTIHVPRDLQELAVRVGKTEPQMEAELGRAPTAAEAADRLDCSVEELLEAREAAGANRVASLDAPARGEDDDAAGLAERLGEEDASMAQVERLLALNSAMTCLDDREREILRLRFGQELTQSEIGKRLGISQMHVSRLIRRSLERLRATGAQLDCVT